MYCKIRGCQNPTVNSRNWFCDDHEEEMKNLHDLYKSASPLDELNGRLIFSGRFENPIEYFLENLGHAHRVVHLMNILISQSNDSTQDTTEDGTAQNPINID